MVLAGLEWQFPCGRGFETSDQAFGGGGVCMHNGIALRTIVEFVHTTYFILPTLQPNFITIEPKRKTPFASCYPVCADRFSSQ